MNKTGLCFVLLASFACPAHSNEFWDTQRKVGGQDAKTMSIREANSLNLKTTFDPSLPVVRQLSEKYNIPQQAVTANFETELHAFSEWFSSCEAGITKWSDKKEAGCPFTRRSWVGRVWFMGHEGEEVKITIGWFHFPVPDGHGGYVIWRMTDAIEHAQSRALFDE